MANSDMRFEHAWRHFQTHSSQRMQNWQYALTFSAAIYAASAAALELDARHFVQVACGVGVVATFMFWNIDRRTRKLIHLSEIALKELEADFPDGSGRSAIFAASERSAFWALSYTQAFLFVFFGNIVAFTVLGFPDLVRRIAASFGLDT